MICSIGLVDFVMMLLVFIINALFYQIAKISSFFEKNKNNVFLMNIKFFHIFISFFKHLNNVDDIKMRKKHLILFILFLISTVLFISLIVIRS